MINVGLKNLASNAASTMVRQISAGLLQIATLALIARAFGPEGSGLYALALLLPMMLATVLNLGIGSANVYYLGGGQIDPKDAWRVTFRISMAIIAMGMILGTAAILIFGKQWFPGVSDQILWLALATFPILFLYTAIGNVFQGLQEFKKFNLVLIVQPIGNLLLISGVVLLSDLDIFYIVACYFISSLINLLLAYKLLYQTLNTKSGPKISGYARKLVNYGYKAHLSNILAFVNNRADMFLIGFFVGPAAVGIYAVAVNIVEKLWLFSGAVSTVLLPRLSQLSGDEEKRNVLTPLIARWSLWATLAAALGLTVMGQLIVSLLFGEAFLQAYSVIVWLLPGVVLGACSMVLANDMAARGRPDLNLATSWISVLINIGGNIVLIPRFGIEGAAAATSFAYVINMMMRLAMHSHFTGVKFTKNLLMGPEDWALMKTVYQKAVRTA